MRYTFYYLNNLKPLILNILMGFKLWDVKNNNKTFNLKVPKNHGIVNKGMPSKVFMYSQKPQIVIGPPDDNSHFIMQINHTSSKFHEIIVLLITCVLKELRNVLITRSDLLVCWQRIRYQCVLYACFVFQ